ncbi:hypothetical protein DW006_03595 [Eubacterium sp. AF36-5BH]|uniref:hypothetical protein n=1 Tax=Eubacterium sp. AF36-5BH TaxID=2293108 RepID=UPI000E552181|nr:hypothetical protein [Eubacterium sp. AF36-5BH]RGF51906.1 hypothetical protein DW006_03595 [Eubacterium sp. AF36-5BH]
MRKVFNKVVAGATSVALIATLALGVNFASSVKADDATTLAAPTWSFTQGGQYNPNEPDNTGYIESVNVGSEVLSGWERKVNGKQVQSSSTGTTGFTMKIENTGWDKDWGNDRINPWSVMATNTIEGKAGHIYTVSFKAKASKKKYAYVAFNTETEGLAPYDQAPVEFGGDASNQIITLGTTEKTFTFTFSNYVSAKEITTAIMLGSFNSQNDYAGNDVKDIIKETEVSWNGTVVVSDFTITDKGVDPGFTEPETKPTQPSVDPTKPSVNPTKPSVNPTQPSKPSVQPTTPAKKPAVKKLAKVKGIKAVNKKKGTLKITWKKVTGATSYKVKVGKKTYTAKKTSLTVKKLKKGKKVTIKISAQGPKAKYKASAWASKKVKIKK